MTGLIKPMLARSNTGAGGARILDPIELLKSGQWVAEPKFDGIRALVHKGRIYSRTLQDITHLFPELNIPSMGTSQFDGEIVAEDDHFETALLRASQTDPITIKQMSITHPCKLVVFDIASSSEPWVVRHIVIEAVDWAEWAPASDKPEFLEIVSTLGMEGVILKRKQSYYQPGARSSDWIKVKYTHRVTCLANGYEPGSGQRAEFGAMNLTMVTGAGQAQNVGRVGTGFTKRDLVDLRTRIDRGDNVFVEIECLGVTSGGKLRQPTFRGIRSDVDIFNCGVEQLSALPTS